MRVTSLARSAAPWHPAVAWAWLASGITLLATTVAHGLEAGVSAGVAVYLGCAIVRELAPRRVRSSLLAPAAVLAFAAAGQADLATCACVLLATRIASRIVGDPPTLLDHVLVLAFVAWLVARPIGLAPAVVLSAIVFVDHGPRSRVAGAAMLLVVLVAGALQGTLTMRPSWEAPTVLAGIALALCALGALLLVARPAPKRLRARDDHHGRALLGARVRSARLAAVASILGAVAWTGVEAPFELASVSGAVVAAGLAGSRYRSDTLHA